MAEIKLNHPIAEIHGSLSKRSNIVNRQKKYRVNGRVISEGKQESYAIQNPRDWKKTPATGAELANQNVWQEACRRAAQILQTAQPDGPTEQQLFERRINQIPDYYTFEEARTLLEEFRRRFDAQIPNTRGKHPDAQAPIDSKTAQGKQYAQFPAFIRAMLYHQLKAQLLNSWTFNSLPLWQSWNMWHGDCMNSIT